MLLGDDILSTRKTVQEEELKFEPFVTKRASEAVYEQIRDRILSGEIRPGDRLPSERDLMKMLQRSRPTVREALRMLERSGMIKTIPGSGGAIVTELTAEYVRQPLESMILLKQISKPELVEYRILNTASCTCLAAIRRTEEDLEELQKIITRLEACIDNYEAFIKCDVEFYSAIVSAGKNEIASIIDKVLSSLILEHLYSSIGSKSAPIINSKCLDILEMHKDLYSAIKDRDAQKTWEIIQEHFKRFESDLGS